MIVKLVFPIYPKIRRLAGECFECGAVFLDPYEANSGTVICPACKTESHFQVIYSDIQSQAAFAVDQIYSDRLSPYLPRLPFVPLRPFNRR